jgi:hypothetical protein
MITANQHVAYAKASWKLSLRLERQLLHRLRAAVLAAQAVADIASAYQSPAI